MSGYATMGCSGVQNKTLSSLTNPVCGQCKASGGGGTMDDQYYCRTCLNRAITIRARQCFVCEQRECTLKSPCGHYLCKEHAPREAFSILKQLLGCDDEGNDKHRHSADPCRACGEFDCLNLCTHTWPPPKNCERRTCGCMRCCTGIVCRTCYESHKQKGKCGECKKPHCPSYLVTCQCCRKEMCRKCLAEKAKGVSLCDDCHTSHLKLTSGSKCEKCKGHRCGEHVRCSVNRCKTDNCKGVVCPSCEPSRCKDCVEQGLTLATRPCTFCNQRKLVVYRRTFRCATPECDYNASAKMCDDCAGTLSRIHRLMRDGDKFYCDNCDELTSSYVSIE